MDRWGEAVVYVGLAIGLGEVGLSLGMPLAAAAMASAFMVSYVRAKSESLGFTSGRGMASVGLAPREVRIVILSAGLIGAGALSPQAAGSLADGFAGAGGGVIGVWYMVLVGSLALITVLATITTIQRILHVYREAKQQEQQ